jgi:hypothetical protein
MTKIKTFSAYDTMGAFLTPNMDKKVNEWLSSRTHLKIINVSTTVCKPNSDYIMFCTVTYEEE